MATKIQMMKKVEVSGPFGGRSEVRVIAINAGDAYQAQTRDLPGPRTAGGRPSPWEDFGPQAETQDHAYYWAFEAVRRIMKGRL